MSFKKVFKITVTALMVLIVAILSFYLWASSPNYSSKNYTQLVEKDYPQLHKNDSTYSIITYNIGYLSGMTNNLPVPKPLKLFEANLNKVHKEFKLINPDIICFQEIDYHSKRSYYINQHEELQKLGYSYGFKAINWDKKYLPFPYFPFSIQFGEILSGQSILSKYPIIDAQRIVLDRVKSDPFYIDAFYLDRLVQISKIKIDDKTVIIINVHLEAFDKDTRTKHVRKVIELYNLYKDTFPVLLVGDFNSNATDNNATIRKVIALLGINSAVSNNVATFPSSNPIKRLDYIFYNEAFIELVSAEVLTSFEEASDHLPVMMKFKLRNK